MELRIDRLLNELRSRTAEVLAAIDHDPLLRKREIGELVLANATKELFTPLETHHLFAKGIVYRRGPYQLISIPLLKIYNLGEKLITVRDLEELAAPEKDGIAPRLNFLRKYDGSMIQRFQHGGRVWYSTRGILEGMSIFDADSGDEAPAFSHFDYLGAARRIAERDYPVANECAPAFDGLTLIFELIHPDARIITDYGDREDLILIAVFDCRRWGYLTYVELIDFSHRHGFTVVDAFSPAGLTLAEQLDNLLATIAGTDQEGTVLTIEHGPELVYRVKSKSPDYLKLMRLMVHCNYGATVDMLDTFPVRPTWPEFEVFLRAQGTDKVPEEVLALYQQYHDQFTAYLGDVERLREWAIAMCATVKAAIVEADSRVFRKAFAEKAKAQPHAALLFTALDGRLDLTRVRQYAATPEEVAEALKRLD